MTITGSALLQKTISDLTSSGAIDVNASMEQKIQQATAWLQDHGDKVYGKNDAVNGDAPGQFAPLRPGTHWYSIIEGKVAYGQAGNDLMHVDGGTAFGGEGNDEIAILQRGGLAYGGNGDDIFRFRACKDGSTVLGGAGNDTFGEKDFAAENAVIYGGFGNDTMFLGRESVAKYNSINEMGPPISSGHNPTGDVINLMTSNSQIDFSEMDNTSSAFDKLQWSSKTDANGFPSEFTGVKGQAIFIPNGTTPGSYLMQVDADGDGKADRQIVVNTSNALMKDLKIHGKKFDPKAFIKF